MTVIIDNRLAIIGDRWRDIQLQIQRILQAATSKEVYPLTSEEETLLHRIDTRLMTQQSEAQLSPDQLRQLVLLDEKTR